MKPLAIFGVFYVTMAHIDRHGFWCGFAMFCVGVTFACLIREDKL